MLNPSSGEKPHVCKLCNKAFAQLPHLKKHMLCVHNTDKPYYCEICQGFFKVSIVNYRASHILCRIG